MADEPGQNSTGESPVRDNRQKFKVVEYSPLLTCLGDPAKFRIIAQLSPAPEDTLMVMDSFFEKATYSKKVGALLIRRENSIITLYSGGIVAMTRLASGDHGRQILKETVDRINASLATGNTDDIRQGSGARRQIDPFEINGHLPRSNCGKCGFKSCFFFATLLAFSEVGIEKCTPLLDESNTASREAVTKLIKSSG